MLQAKFAKATTARHLEVTTRYAELKKADGEKFDSFWHRTKLAWAEMAAINEPVSVEAKRAFLLRSLAGTRFGTLRDSLLECGSR